MTLWKDWRRVLVSPDVTIRQALQTIDDGTMQIALVVDDQQRLLGTVTDGDVRRGILKGLSLEAPVSKVMNTLPTVARPEDDPAAVFALMKLKLLQQVPIVDEDARVVGLERLEELISTPKQDNWVVLMAGGLGSRLAPLTDDCPKPLLRVGGKPILETIIQTFIDHGFTKFYVSVNYKAEMIMDFLGRGERWGAEIRYLHERERLGTAGALRLLPDRPDKAFFVMNADLITTMNARQLLAFHEQRQGQATLAIREYNLQVPYGVVRVQDDRLVGIDEKPIHKLFISSGIYVLSPSVLEELPPHGPLDMPDFLQTLIAKGYTTITFPIREYWMDVGRMEDFLRANHEYTEVFQE